MAAQLTGPKAPFDGVAIRCTAADIPKYRGRYVTLMVRGTSMSADTLKGNCCFTNMELSISGFNTTNITTITEITCYVDNQNAVLVLEHFAAVDDDVDLKTYELLMTHMHKHSAIFGF